MPTQDPRGLSGRTLSPIGIVAITAPVLEKFFNRAINFWAQHNFFPTFLPVFWLVNQGLAILFQ
jgi:hypothetical protein